MLKNLAIGVVCLGFTLSLPACMAGTDAAGTDAAGTDTAGEDVGQASAALVYTGPHVQENGSNAGAIYSSASGFQAAINRLVAWGMPVAVDDFCANPPWVASFCKPTPSSPHPALVRFMYTPGGAWGPYHFTSDASAWNVFEKLGGQPNGLPISCQFRTFPESEVFPDLPGWWHCSTGTGGQWGWATIDADYYNL
jgi:hypothetical protein